MDLFDWLQLGAFLATLTVAAYYLGDYLRKVFEGKPFRGRTVFERLERGIYRLSGVNTKVAMTWREYTYALLLFNLLGFLFLFGLLLLQHFLPLQPAVLQPMTVGLAFNTAVSFVTNTNWQSYAGEVTLSPLTQAVGLTVQNFLSAATGFGVLLALARGVRNQSSAALGNFWQDVTRSVVYVLIPLSVLFAAVLVSQGVIQNLSTGTEIITLEGARQTIPGGLVASQEAIKQLGTNGGGFFGVNSAHPFENPTPLTNFLEMLAILLIPAALPLMFGRMIGNIRQGTILFGVMMGLFVVGLSVVLYGEYSCSPHNTAWMEGKETRFGLLGSAMWAQVTTCASNGSVNAMHDSLSPLGGLTTMLNMMLGEVIFGGVGSGLYGMVIFVILSVFIAGLMVGRTPELWGKKIEGFEIHMAVLAVLAPNFVILFFTALTLLLPSALSSLGNEGPHGFSEILYAFTSAAGNNGSAFGGLNANTDYFNYTLGIGMLIGRFGIILPVLAIAGSFAVKKRIPASPGTLPTDTPVFAGLLVSIILLVGALSFFPALSLGPIIEHLMN